LAYTLLELARTHGCPMIVRDIFTHNWYAVLRPETDGSTIFEAKPMLPNSKHPATQEPIHQIYGGYARWVFISKMEQIAMTPEEQKRVREEERKKNNAKILRDLKRSKEAKAWQTPPKPKVSSKSSDMGQVIEFKPRPKKDQ